MPGFYLDDSDYEGLTALMDRQPYNSPSIPETPPPAPAFPQYSSPDAYVPYTPPPPTQDAFGTPPNASPWASGTYSPPPPEPPPFQPSSPWASGTYDPFSGPQLPGGAPDVQTYTPREMGGGLLSPPPISTGDIQPTNYTSQEAQQARNAAWPSVYPQDTPDPWAGPWGLATGPFAAVSAALHPVDVPIQYGAGALNILTGGAGNYGHGSFPTSLEDIRQQGASSYAQRDAALRDLPGGRVIAPIVEATGNPSTYVGATGGWKTAAELAAATVGGQVAGAYAPEISQATHGIIPEQAVPLLATLGVGYGTKLGIEHGPGAVRAVPGGIDAITRAQERLLPPSRFGSSELGGTEPLPPRRTSPIDPSVDQALNDAGVRVNEDGTVTLYHGTTAANAKLIQSQGRLKSAGEPDIYVSTDPKGIAQSYGDGTVVPVRVRASDLVLEDEFPGGRVDFRIPVGKGREYPLFGSSELGGTEPLPRETPRPVNPEEINAIVRQGEYEHYGLRVTPERLPIGEPAPASRLWENGVPTSRVVEGVSTIDVSTPEKLARAMNLLKDYHGDNVTLVGGNSRFHGADIGEIVIPDGIAIDSWNKSARPPVPNRATIEPPPPKPPVSSKVPIPEDARTQVLDALKENLRLRMSGAIEAQKTAGRARQVAGASSALSEAIQQGAQGEERIAAMRGGLKTGRIIESGTPLNLTPETRTSILNAITDAHQNGTIQTFDAVKLAEAFDTITQGYRPQPRQLAALADAFGPEVRGLIKDFPKPPQTIAKLLPEDVAAIKAAQKTPVPGEQRTVDERSIRRWEIQSQRQHELATQLEEQARLNPTNKRLQAAAETARSRVLDYQNKADEATRTSIERDLLKRTKQAGNANVRAQTPEARAAQTRETVDAQIKQDAAQPYYDDAMKKAMETLGKPAPDSLAAKTATVRRGDTTTEPLNRVAAQTMRSWAENNRTILDGMGADGPTFVSRVKGLISGGPADSFSATLMARRAVLRTALEKANVEPATASAISRILTQAEIRARFGDNVPAFVRDAIEKTKSIAPGEAKILEGTASLSQEFKNTQFGIGDMAVFGQQGLKAGTTAWPQLIAGAVNRMLLKAHLGGVDLYALADNLPPELRATLDGLGTGHATGIADFAHGEGTLLRHLPIVGRVDPALSHVIDRMTDFQFRTVLGSVRRVNYEGNLLIAKALGKDITNPVVRQQAAIFANSATSFSHGALNTRRALGERAILLSPSMRRAQVSQILQLGKLLDGSATERALAATTLLAWTGSVLSIGKLVNDQVGTGDFEWFPWNSGFGQVKLKDGTTVDLFPQEQVLKTVTRAAKDIAEVNPKDAEAAARQLDYGAFFGSKGFRDVAQLGITSSSPPLQAAERSVGVGYDPGRGYTYGDFGAGTDLKTRLANALPVPPIAAPAVRNLARNGVADTASDLAHPNIPAAAANFAGFNTFPESLTAQRTRDLGANPTRAQVETWNAAHPEQVRAQAESFGGTAVARLDLKQQSVSDQLVFDNQLRDGRLKPADWRAAYASIRDDIQNQQKALDKVDPLPPAKDRVVRAYQQTIDNAKITDQLDPQYGKTDWGKVDAYTASLSPADQKVIEDNRAPGITPTVQQYKDDMAKMRGYFDAGDPLWRDVVGPAFNAPPGIEPAQFFAQKRAAVMAQYRDNPQLGSAIADKVVASYESKWAKIEALAKKQWLSQNIDKVDALARWGYGGKIARDLALVNGQ